MGPTEASKTVGQANYMTLRDRASNVSDGTHLARDHRSIFPAGL